MEELRIGITCGDLNGIGMEVIIKTFMDARMAQVCTPVIYGSSKALSYHRKAINALDFAYNTIRSVEVAAHRKVNILNCWEEEVKIDLGTATDVSGKYAFKALEVATSDLAAGKIDA